MNFWKRDDGVERKLRALRREPRPEFLEAVANKVHGDRYRRPTRSLRLGLVGALTAGMLVALASFGGLGNAASGVSRAVQSAVHVVSPAAKTRPDNALSSAAAQYIVTMCIRGHTIYVDHHAVPGLTRAGATPGPCSGTAAPRGSKKLVFVCFRGQSIKVQKRSVPAMRQVGATKGKCKKK
jgi:hypothetical protein